MELNRITHKNWMSLGTWILITGSYGWWSLNQYLYGFELMGLLLSWVVMLTMAWLWSQDKLFISLLVLLLWLVPVHKTGELVELEQLMSVTVSQALLLMLMLGTLMGNHPLKKLNVKADLVLLVIAGLYLIQSFWWQMEMNWYLLWWWKFMAVGYLSWGMILYVKERWLGVGMVLGVMLILVTERLVSWVGGMW